jgi:hypothetical protein
MRSNRTVVRDDAVTSEGSSSNPPRVYPDTYRFIQARDPSD